MYVLLKWCEIVQRKGKKNWTPEAYFESMIQSFLDARGFKDLSTEPRLTVKVATLTNPQSEVVLTIIQRALNRARP